MMMLVGLDRTGASPVQRELAVDARGCLIARPCAIATNGDIVFPDEWAQTITKNSDGTVATIDITSPDTALVYRQSYTYPTTISMTISRWVKQ